MQDSSHSSTAHLRDPRLHFRTPIMRSPFHPRLAEYNKLDAWVPWAGAASPIMFEDVAMEYMAIRSRAGVYDISPMIKYRIAGPDAVPFLNRLTLRDVAKLKIGHVHYTAWCDGAGKLLDDGTLFRRDAADFMLCCQERHLPWLRDSAIGYDVVISDITDTIAALSLQGPCSWSVLERAGFAAVEQLKPFQCIDLTFGDGYPVMISRTGFTADLGYELWVAPEHALALWDLLFEAGALYDVRPFGSAALNMARIEAGFIQTNVEFIAAEQALRSDRTRSPLELGLGWMIDFDKGHFNGRRALLAERDNGTSKRALVGLDIAGNVEAEHALIYHDKKREVGIVTAAIWSPTLKASIALAMIERPYDAAKSGNLWVEIYAMREGQYHKLMERVRIVPRTFFDPPRRRATPPGRF